MEDYLLFNPTSNLYFAENPELVKPIVTTVDNKELSVQFFLPSLTGFLNKTKEDINSKESIPAINKVSIV